MITADTRVIALIGDPVGHSVSPAMHDAAFKALGLNYIYLAFRVPVAGLAQAIEGIRGLGLAGANVTIPHKTAVLPLLDSVNSQANRIGAVNTIMNQNGRLIGYNTDASGFLAALKGGSFEPEGKKAVVLGAGGVARAAVFALGDAGASVAIVNRTAAAARKLAGETGSSVFEMTENGFHAALEGVSLVVNATSVGMSPDDGSTPLPATFLRPGMTVIDTVYRPRRTRLLAEAEAAGCTVVGGLEMLVEQGALAFELWTGIPAPRQVMRQAAAEALLP
ncbi:shikimate dehydrogenase [Dehalogenimonas sp. THU2]|uniref:shikimate dehydrogenase n=1 Tax=Dehalogenimonas sp. THU2 TaxID=3151121 RepID=UPI0032184DB0